MSLSFPLARDAPLATLTTLAVGGPARYLARPADAAELAAMLVEARRKDLPVFVLGGGSNLLVADRGFDGLVVRLGDEAVELRETSSGGRVAAGGGGDWDALVARAVVAGLGGIECLSGIPGTVGAAPVQNIGAYGQELAPRVARVDAVRLDDAEARRFSAADCGFGYRQSHFKGRWHGRYAITRVELDLPRRSHGETLYPDLEARFAGADRPSLSAVRDAVLDVRRAKSMVLEADDPNRRSAGSFFVNPVVSTRQADEIAALVGGEGMPRYSAAAGVKLSAAWLIERSGFSRGAGDGPAGLSTRHSLALVNRGGASAADLVAFAGAVRRAVRRRFAVTLKPEPVFLGFERSVDELLG